MCTHMHIHNKTRQFLDTEATAVLYRYLGAMIPNHSKFLIYQETHTFKLENGNVGRTATQSLCKISLHTHLQEALFPPGTPGSDLGRSRGSPQTQQWRKEVIPDVLQDSRLKCAHVRTDFAYLRLAKGSHIHEVSGATKLPSE